MPIDASIPLGIRPVNIETGANRLAMMESAAKLGEYQNAIAEQNALRDYIKTADLNTPEGRQGLLQYGKTGFGYNKALGEQEKLGYETKKLKAETTEKELNVQREQFGNLAFNPSNENVIAHLQDSVLQGKLTKPAAQQLLDKVLPMDGKQRSAFFTDMGMKAAERAQLQETKRGHDLTYGATIRGQNLQYNPELQGQIAEAKKVGEVRAEAKNAPVLDIAANRKALASAGYDPVTGKDSISELINKSTGSYLGAGTDIAGRVVGVSTEGGKAIKQLETHANKMALDMMNGKLGAGISNADRDFIVAGLGDVANPTIPRETRLAAWNDVKARMMKAGMVEAPKEAPAAPTTTKSGASVSNW